MKKYLLDTNIFIEAYKNYYPKEIVPSFWDFLVKDGNVFTLAKVKEEIKSGKDDLPELIEKVKIFNKPFSGQQDISTYIKDKYENSESVDFLSKVDYLLICVAREHGLIVVTHEKEVGSNAKKIKIPNICQKFGVKHVNTFEMLKNKEINLCEYKLKN